MGELLKRNEELLGQWVTICKEKEPNSHFVKDGLLYRGDIYYNGGKWDRRPSNNEDNLLSNVPIKIIFLMKDFTNLEMDDIRYETMRRNDIPPILIP